MASSTPSSGTVAEALAHGARLLRLDPVGAAAQAREILGADPANADAFRLLGEALRKSGEDEAAERAELDAIGASVHDPELMRAAEALLDNDLPTAERILRPRLKAKPLDVAAIRMMAELAARIGRFGDAENLLRRALELAPGFAAARANLATVLYRQNRPAEAVAILDELLGGDPDNAGHRNLKAAALGRIGGYEEALALYADLLRRFPEQPKVWMSYGHLLKTVGRRDDSIAAYRRAIAIAPTLGEVWWSLANLKTVTLDAGDVAAMEAALGESGLSDEDRYHLHFALGKALEDSGKPVESFAHYDRGNALRREGISYEAERTSEHVRRSEALFTPPFFAEREGHGSPAPDPIFILGMPRAGSTLIEQILASHSAIEGTMELPDVPALARRLGAAVDGGSYLDLIGALGPADCAALGEEYLERTRVQRKSGRPLFIDKMPNNWAHIGLIHLILPNARIIDARRHPLGCCFSNFKQHFARGQGFAYSQEDLGRYYADYVALLRHYDAVLPGRVCRVFYEDMVADPERQIRRLLAHLELPFEEACLQFHRNERAVRTASSEQVRRPINREGLDQWQPFAPWLGPLKEALGPVLDRYPEVPEAPAR